MPYHSLSSDFWEVENQGGSLACHSPVLQSTRSARHIVEDAARQRSLNASLAQPSERDNTAPDARYRESEDQEYRRFERLSAIFVQDQTGMLQQAAPADI